MLRIQNLSVEREGTTICRVRDLEMARGDRIAIVGPNGSGKTTLLRIASGLESDFTGECLCDVPRRGRVYVHQSPYLFHGSVIMNVAYGLAARGLPRRERISVARRWLGTFGIEHLAGRRCGRLSRGERRRLALARAFALQAELLLLDEPLADLDPEGIETVCRVIAAVSGSTMLIASPVPLPPSLSLRMYQLPDNGPKRATGPKN